MQDQRDAEYDKAILFDGNRPYPAPVFPDQEYAECAVQDQSDQFIPEQERGIT